MGVEDKPKLYLRFPVKVRDVQIKDLNSKILDVALPRQKSARWCIVSFADNNTLTLATEELKKVKIEGKRLKISSFKKNQKRHAKSKEIAATADTESLKLLINLLDKDNQ